MMGAKTVTLSPGGGFLLELTGSATVFTPEMLSDEQRMMRDTVELYQLIAAQTPRVSVEFYDPVINPAQARSLGVNFAGTAVMESEGRRLQVNGGNETDIANGILRVSRSATQQVCFLEGHSEPDPFSLESHDHLEGAPGHTHGLGAEGSVKVRMPLGAAVDGRAVLVAQYESFNVYEAPATATPDLAKSGGEVIDCVADAGDVEYLFSRQLERFGVLSWRELQRQNAHADEIRAMNAFVAFGDNCAHAEQRRTFRGPVARRSRAVLLAREND